MTERWVAVDGWEGFYEVSDAGRVRSLDRTIYLTNRFGKPESRFQTGQVLAASAGNNGYCVVAFTRPGGVREDKYVHNLVAEAFVEGAAPGLEVCHRDGVRAHCSWTNLRWGTRSSNALDRHEHGTMNQAHGEDHYFRKLTAAEARWVRSKKGVLSQRALAAMLGVTHSTIGQIQRGNAWRRA